MKLALILAAVFGLIILSLVPALSVIASRAPRLIDVPEANRIKLDQGNVRYQSSGQGHDAVLFLHGFNSQLSIWEATWPHLKDCARSVRIDIPGFGGSNWDSSSYSLSDQAERVISFMDALGLVR